MGYILTDESIVRLRRYMQQEHLAQEEGGIGGIIERLDYYCGNERELRVALHVVGLNDAQIEDVTDALHQA